MKDDCPPTLSLRDEDGAPTCSIVRSSFTAIRARLQSCRNNAQTGRASAPAIRWLKFNLVGAAGMLVQLGLLEAWMHFSLGNYLLGTALAVEATLLHNFGWHCVFTWRERPAPNAAVTWIRAVRFQLSNGAVSLIGNLLLTQLLVSGLGSPLLVANLGAIAVCSGVNFLLGDRWVFGDPG